MHAGDVLCDIETDKASVGFEVDKHLHIFLCVCTIHIKVARIVL